MPFRVDQEARRRYEALRAAPVKRDPPKYRVLIPTPEQLAAGVRLVDATDTQTPRAARTLAEAASAALWGQRVTYALAEDLASGELIHSVAVRLRRGPIAAWAVWRNGGFNSAMWMDRKIGYRELLAAVRDSYDR